MIGAIFLVHAVYTELREEGRHFVFGELVTNIVLLHAPALDRSWTIYECEKSVCSAGEPVGLGQYRPGQTAPSLLASGPCGVYIQHGDDVMRRPWPGSGVWILRNSVPFSDRNSDNAHL